VKQNQQMHQPCQEEPVCLLDLVSDSSHLQSGLTVGIRGRLHQRSPITTSTREFDAISSILPYHKAGQGWHGFLRHRTHPQTEDTAGLAWPELQRARYARHAADTQLTRSHQGPLLPKSDVNLCPESCFYHKTSNAKRFKAVAWRRPKCPSAS